MTRERIEDFREIVLPFLSRTLLKTNYENMGKSDAEEFEKDFNEILDMAIKALEQEPKTGHWIIIDDCEKFIAKCSECEQIEDSRMIGKYAYCHCGARMESEI